MSYESTPTETDLLMYQPGSIGPEMDPPAFGEVFLEIGATDENQNLQFVHDLRGQLGEALSNKGVLGYPQEDAVLVASELATNALHHGGGFRSIKLGFLEDKPDRLLVAVADRTDAHTKKRAPGVVKANDNELESGRGLNMVGMLCVEGAAGHKPESEGKIVFRQLQVARCAIAAFAA